MPKMNVQLPPRKGGARTEMYPFDEWLDGDVWLLVKGQEFNATVASIRSSLMGAANKRHVTIETRTPDKDFLSANGVKAKPEDAILVQASAQYNDTEWAKITNERKTKAAARNGNS